MKCIQQFVIIVSLKESNVMENNKKAEIKTDLHAMNKMLMAQLPELERKKE